MPLPTWTKHPFNNASWIAVTMQLRSAQSPQHTQLQNLGTVQHRTSSSVHTCPWFMKSWCFGERVNQLRPMCIMVHSRGSEMFGQPWAAHRHQTSMVVYHNGSCREALDHLFLMLIPLHYLPNIKFFKSWFQAEFCTHYEGNKPDTDILSSESFAFIQTKWGWELCHSNAALGSGWSLKF